MAVAPQRKCAADCEEADQSFRRQQRQLVIAGARTKSAEFFYHLWLAKLAELHVNLLLLEACGSTVVVDDDGVHVLYCCY